jgi:hypothetical protein
MAQRVYIPTILLSNFFGSGLDALLVVDIDVYHFDVASQVARLQILRSCLALFGRAASEKNKIGSICEKLCSEFEADTPIR